MSPITDDDINRAAQSVAASLHHLLEFKIPEDHPDYMEVTRAERTRESKLRGVRRGSPLPVTSERMGL